MVARNALVLIGGELAEMPIGDTLNGAGGGGGGVGASGVVELDFGASGKTDVAFDVTGQDAILAGSLPRAWILAKATVDRSIDEHRIEEIDVVAGNVQAGTGFTIYGKTRNAPLFGKFNVAWSW